MIGLRTEPPTDKSLVLSLIENSWTELMALGGWIVAFAATGALLIVVGQVVAINTWHEPAKTQALIVAAAPLGISAMGLIIRTCFAGLAVSAAHKLAVERRPARAYHRLVCRLTTTTPWVLVPQVLLGVGAVIFIASHRVR
jgi:hypothetical protein